MHDIGKNIVGVVLQCNNFEVIDLGVMVPANKILEEARAHDVDIIGLSGLITPSLDEMVHLAKELQREGFDVPLLIGGATTSRVHTAVKIEPNYYAPSIYVKDASRAVGVASNLISEDLKADYVTKLKAEYEAVRAGHKGKQAKTRWLTLEQARANKTPIDWDAYEPPMPAVIAAPPSVSGASPLPQGEGQGEGIKPEIVSHDGHAVLRFRDYPLEEIAQYLDWTPFFHAWQLKGSYPKILDDAEKGEEARKLFEDGKKMLQQIIDEKWLKANAVIGLWPANADGDDVILYKDENRDAELTRLHFLRQQTEKPPGRPNQCLADFVAPKESGKPAHVGAFACTAGAGIDEKLAELEADHDDYHAIMLKALADRLAEAFAELLHAKARREYWGYGKDEDLSNEELIKERYRGIRPAAGYPACPDHTEKDILWALLNAYDNTGMWLTESKAMVPTAAVSGVYFAHPEAKYFAVGKLNRDQIADYAKRKGMSVEEAERWLGPNLGYDPDEVQAGETAKEAAS